MNVVYLLFLGLCFLSHSQNKYAASAEHPYGLPNPEAPAEIKDFDALMGTCSCSSQTRNPDQSWAEPMAMTWEWKYIMNGMAVQDETLKADGGHSGSIRQFIADSSKWYVHYYSSKTPTTALPTWEGGKKDDGTIALYRPQQAPNGMDGFYRLTFYDIDDNGYKWVGAWVDPSEQVVFPTRKIHCKR